MRLFGCLPVVFLLLTAVSAGRDIHVDNLAGDDSFTGQHLQYLPDRSGPVRTIAKALRLARSGDRIVLAKTDQPYRAGISLVGSRHSGVLDRPFTIEGSGAILDGSAPVPADGWQHYRGAVFRFRPPPPKGQPGFQQLFLDDRPAVCVPVIRFAEVPPKLEPLEWCLHEGQIYFCVAADKLPQDYRLTYAQQQTGITLFHVQRVAIAKLTVQGFRVDGISAYNSAHEVYLTGVTARGNGRSGLTVGGASTLEIDGCVVGDNGQAQLLTLPYSETSVCHSQLFANTAPAWVDQGGRVYIDGKQVEGGLDKDVMP